MKTCLGTMTKIARKAVSVVLVVLIALGTVALSSCGESSSLSITEEKEYYDNGAVKKETYSYPNGQASKICEYNEAGVMTSMVEYFEDGSIYRECVIGENGVISQKTEYVRRLVNKTLDYHVGSVSSYDDKGRIVSITSNDEYGRSEYQTFCEYAYPEDGVIIENRRYSFMDYTDTTTMTFDGKILRKYESESFDAPGGHQIQGTVFDDAGNITLQYFQSGEERQEIKHILTYDEHNNIIKDECNGLTIPYTNTYGSDGKIEKVHFLSTSDKSLIYTFDSGNMIKYECYDSDGKILEVREYFSSSMNEKELFEDRLAGSVNALGFLVDGYKKLKCVIFYENGKETSKTEYYENGTKKIPKKYW